MPLIITPGQLRIRAELYHQLGVTIAAGLSIHQSLEHIKNNPPSRSLKPMVAQWLENLQAGHPVVESLRMMGNSLPSFDLALLEAGEQSGRLDQCFKLLALYYQDKAQMAQQVISDLMYPMFIFHFAIVLFAFVSYLQPGGRLVNAITTIAVVFVPLYAGAFLLLFACQGRRGERWRAAIEAVLRPIPLLGTARRDLALARLSAALEALLNAGVGIIGAWELAATASGSPSYRRTVLTWRAPLEQGLTPSELVSASPRFPDIFRNLYHTGETSGQLDETLGRLHTLYQEEGSRKMRMVSQWTPRIIYFGIVCFVAFRIIAFYTGYFNQINQIIDGR
jgi:type II secretory pathway component PulF